jgi:hypothetical protein
MSGWRIAWELAINLFYIGVVIAVFASMPDSGTKQIIAVLGLIYCALRQQFIASTLASVERYLVLYGMISKVDSDNSDFHAEQMAEARKEKANSAVLIGIHSIALGAIAVISLFVFFTTTTTPSVG